MTTIARFAARCCNLQSIDPAGPSSPLQLGVKRGRLGPRHLAILLKAQCVLLVVGQQELELARLISWTNDGLRVDLDQLVRLTNRKQRSPATHAGAVVSPRPDRHALILERDREIERLGQLLRQQHKSWPTIAEEISRMPFLATPKNGLKPIKADTVRRILTRRTAP